jgi:PAS domain-containing protein
MKSSENDTSLVSRRGTGENEATNGHEGKYTVSPPSWEDGSSPRGSFEEPVDEGTALRNMIKMDRSLAHELNNYFTTILASIQLVLLMLKDEEPKPYLEAAEDAVQNASKSVRDFQDRARSLAQRFLQESESDMTPHSRKMERETAESKEWLSTILRSIADAVIVTDTEGCVEFMNPVAESLMG